VHAEFSPDGQSDARIKANLAPEWGQRWCLHSGRSGTRILPNMAPAFGLSLHSGVPGARVGPILMLVFGLPPCILANMLPVFWQS